MNFFSCFFIFLPHQTVLLGSPREMIAPSKPDTVIDCVLTLVQKSGPWGLSTCYSWHDVEKKYENFLKKFLIKLE